MAEFEVVVEEGGLGFIPFWAAGGVIVTLPVNPPVRLMLRFKKTSVPRRPLTVVGLKLIVKPVAGMPAWLTI